MRLPLTRRSWEARLRGYQQNEIAKALQVSQATVSRARRQLLLPADPIVAAQSRALRRAERAATASAEPTLARWRFEALAPYELLSKPA